MMKTCRNVTLFAVAAMTLYATPPTQAAVPGTGAAATVYQVQVKQVDLCTDSSCSSYHTLGSSTQTFDIASVSAGAQIGSYANASGLIPGTTYTYVKVTIDESITMSGSGTDGDVSCATDATPAQDGDANTAEVSNNTGTAESEEYIIPSDAGDFAAMSDSDWEDLNITIRNTDADAVGDVVITYPLTSSYTVTGVEPLVEISFDTSTALGIMDSNSPGTVAGDGGNCIIFPRPPTVTITVSNP